MRNHLFIYALILSATVSIAAPQPNVVLIVTDDHGYGEVGAHGNDLIKTGGRGGTAIPTGSPRSPSRMVSIRTAIRKAKMALFEKLCYKSKRSVFPEGCENEYRPLIS